MRFALRATLVIVAVAAAVAASINVASAADAPEPVNATSPGVTVRESSTDPAGAPARPVAGRVTGKSCTTDTTHRIARSGKTTHDLVYYACVDVLGSEVRARGKWKKYWANNKHLDRNAPEFYWFKTNIRLEGGSSTTTGVCGTLPKPSDFIDTGYDTSTGEVFGYFKHYAHTCYFDRNQQAGKYYRVSVQHSYDVKGDGKYTLYSPKIYTNYVRG